MKILLAAIFFFLSADARVEDIAWPEELKVNQKQIEHLRRNAPTQDIPSEAAAITDKKIQEAIGNIEAIADKRPGDIDAQIAVGISLASVEEAPRAVPYAERGLELAEASEDPKLIRTALLAGSEIYYKAGNYAVALERAQRVLKNNPKDKDALSLYMQVKGRDAASVPSPAKGATGEMEQTSSATAQAAARGPGVAMTNIASLEARKQIATGWNLIKLDPKAAFGHFDAAVAADPRNAAARVERSKARLETGDAPGALEDAAGAAALEPRLGAAYAARAEARRALGRPHAELLADYETAANLDGRFAEAYKTLLLRGAEAAGKTAGAGAAAPGGLNGLFARSSKAWGPAALLAASAAALGVLIAPLLLKRRRPGEDGSLRR